MNPVDYGKRVLSGEIPAGEFVRLSVARHFEDLKRDWEYYFDEESGMRPIRFFKILRHWRGEFYNRPFNPEPWQAWVLYVFYGWKRKSNDKRRFKYLYIEIPRKNGKTTFMAACTLYHILKDNENAPEVYYAATKERQARICLDEARNIGLQTPEVAKRLVIRKYEIEYPAKNGLARSLGSDSDKQDGLNPSMVILDEVHAHKDFGMFEKLNNAFGARSQPTMMMITTAGQDRSYPCYEYRSMCIEVLHGNKKIDSLLPMIYTLDEEDDWKSMDTWVKVNPSWSILNQEEFNDAAQAAIQFTHKEREFKNWRLNIWTDVNEVWMKAEDWVACSSPMSDTDLLGLPCYAGADFAETKDLCALALKFALPGGDTYNKFYFWVPKKKAYEKEDVVDYFVWANAGHIRIIDGDAIDHTVLASEVLDILDHYQAHGMTYDKYGIGEATIQVMITNGYPVNKLHPIKQTTTFFNGPITAIEEQIGLGKFKHDGSPVMEWNIRNTEVFYDSYGGKKFVKSKARNKIDGSVAMVMAEAEASAAPPPDSGKVWFV